MGNGRTSFSLGGLRRATVKMRGGEVHVAIREWVQNTDGSLKAGKKGINLTVDEWLALQEQGPDIIYVIKTLLNMQMKKVRQRINTRNSKGSNHS